MFVFLHLLYPMRPIAMALTGNPGQDLLQSSLEASQGVLGAQYNC